MKPDILNPKWRYFNSSSTDLRRTFARVRKEQEALKPKPAPVPPNVAQLRKQK
jgi:hypothetical protein